ncbi:hypothetical protein KP509_03G058600 [Ceratopteris richardii]|uniref:Uncharacterized protein n=1 Tax=Ceratopteris richardii TaxID=49495 RepID=A0A8T2V379_CERRI|nr:hypothetical protein KP509_03G058600 [Ceratopteris richardii]
MNTALKFHPFDRRSAGVEAIEDIIDVENEIGFGEGDSYNPQSSSRSRQISDRKKGAQNSSLRSRSQSNSPSRRHVKYSSSRIWPQPTPAYTIRHANSPPAHDEKTSPSLHTKDHNEKPARHSYTEKERMKDDAESMAVQVVGKEVEQEGSKWPSDCNSQCFEEGSEIDVQRESPYMQRSQSGKASRSPQSLASDDRHSEQPSQRDFRHRSMNEETKDDTIRHRNAYELRSNTNAKQSVDQENTPTIDSDIKAEKRREKVRNSNRVRFSLDYDMAEKLLGGHKETKTDPDTEGDEQEKIQRKKQEHKSRERKIVRNGFEDDHVEKSSAPRPRLPSIVTQKEPAALRDGRKDIGFDLETAIQIKEDKKAIRLAQDRIERLEGALLKQQEIVGMLRMALVQEGLKDSSKLRHLLDALEKNIRRLAISRSRHFSESHQLRNRADQVERLKAHCNVLETERDRLKKRLENLLEDTKEKEKQLADLIAERDTHQDNCSQELREEWESKLKKIEASFIEEKEIWEKKLNACKLDWANEKQDWVAELKKKEMELCNLKTSRDKLVELLILCRKGVDDIKETVQSPEVNADQKLRQICSGSEEETDPLELAQHIYSDTEKLKQMLHDLPYLLSKGQSFSYKSHEEKSKELEDKLSRTLHLTERVKQHIQRKEDEILKENVNYEQLIAEKVKELHMLEKHFTGEDDVDVLVNKLKHEVKVLNEELHRERRERSWKLPDVQINMAQDPAEPYVWEGEIDTLKAKLDEVSLAAALKDERIDYLEEQVKVKGDQLAQEKQKWDSAIKEVKQRAAKAIVHFVTGKDNGLLEQLLERKRIGKTSGGRDLPDSDQMNADEETEGVSLAKETCSLRDQLNNTTEKRHKRSRSLRIHGNHLSKSEIMDSRLSNNKKLNEKEDSLLRKKNDLFCSQDEEFGWGAGRRSRRGLDKQDVLDILERQTGRGDTTFALLQCTVQDLE